MEACNPVEEYEAEKKIKSTRVRHFDDINSTGSDSTQRTGSRKVREAVDCRVVPETMRQNLFFLPIPGQALKMSAVFPVEQEHA